ncbi:MAG TPA: NUDIX hydrolase [Candidatus Saccharimonadales bacterium]
MQKWRRVEPTKVQKVGYRVIVSKTYEMPNGQTAVFDTTSAEGQRFIATIALTADGKVIIAEQFRPGPEKIMQELPGGYVDEGESSEQAARRELLEESGYEAGEIISLGTTYKDAFSNASTEYFLAMNCRYIGAPTTHEAEEHVEVKLITVDKLIQNAKSDKMTDGIAVLLAYDKLLELKGAIK